MASIIPSLVNSAGQLLNSEIVTRDGSSSIIQIICLHKQYRSIVEIEKESDKFGILVPLEIYLQTLFKGTFALISRKDFDRCCRACQENPEEILGHYTVGEEAEHSDFVDLDDDLQYINTKQKGQHDITKRNYAMNILPVIRAKVDEYYHTFLEIYRN